MKKRSKGILRELFFSRSFLHIYIYIQIYVHVCVYAELSSVITIGCWKWDPISRNVHVGFPLESTRELRLSLSRCIATEKELCFVGLSIENYV